MSDLLRARHELEVENSAFYFVCFVSSSVSWTKCSDQARLHSIDFTLTSPHLPHSPAITAPDFPLIVSFNSYKSHLALLVLPSTHHHHHQPPRSLSSPSLRPQSAQAAELEREVSADLILYSRGVAPASPHSLNIGAGDRYCYLI